MADGASTEGIPQALIDPARDGEPDRYLAALLAPAQARAGLLALAAFSAEIARIGRLVTREPAMGEMRLQWWRDALELPEALSTGSPVADRIRVAVYRYGVGKERLMQMIEARSLDLQPEPFADEAALARYLADTEGALFALSAAILGADPGDGDVASGAAASGQAYGIARLLLGLGAALDRGRSPIPLALLEAAGLNGKDLRAPVPNGLEGVVHSLCAKSRDSLALARAHVAKIPRPVRCAFLPLALVEPYLRIGERAGYHSDARTGGVTPLARISRIAAAHWLGRL